MSSSTLVGDAPLALCSAQRQTHVVLSRRATAAATGAASLVLAGRILVDATRTHSGSAPRPLVRCGADLVLALAPRGMQLVTPAGYAALQLESHRWYTVALAYDGAEKRFELRIDGAVAARSSAGVPPPELGGRVTFGSDTGALVTALVADWSLGPVVPALAPLAAASRAPLIAEMRPIKSVADLLAWAPGGDPLGVSLRPLQPRQAPPARGVPKNLVCHDFAGGYVGDHLHAGQTDASLYNFTYWAYLDSFCYFAHERVTVPPRGWTDAAHAHGCLSLGTFITEWEPGEAENLAFLERAADGSFPAATKLVDVAEYYRFDGWLVNLEAKVPPELVEPLKDLLSQLRADLEARLPHGLLVWYDSVTVDGQVAYQNKLNEKNYPFFERAGAILPNYFWQAGDPAISNANAGSDAKAADVYTGIDVFGRGTFGGGGYDTHVALDVIDKAPTGACIFAPGWTYEVAASNGDRSEFEDCETRFWSGHVWQELLAKKWNFFENGGDGWKARDRGWVTSHKWCRRSQIVDLRDFGAPASLQPLVVSQWVKGTGPNPNDPYFVTVELLDGAMNRLDAFQTGECTASAVWTRIQHTFTVVPDAARYLRWTDGGKDAEGWQGHYGAVFERTCARSPTQRQEKCVATHVCERMAPAEGMLVSSFDQGVGKALKMDGIELSASSWYDLSAQSLQPTHRLKTVAGSSARAVEARPDYESVYDGGCSWRIDAYFGDPDPAVTLCLFETSVAFDGPIDASFVFSGHQLNIAMVVEYADGTRAELGTEASSIAARSLRPAAPVGASVTVVADDWTRVAGLLPAGTVAKVYVALAGVTGVDTMTVRLGKLALLPASGVPSASLAVTDAWASHNIDGTVRKGVRASDVSLLWEANDATTQVLVRSNGHFAGRTFGTGFVVPAVADDEFPVEIELVPVNAAGVGGDARRVVVDQDEVM